MESLERIVYAWYSAGAADQPTTNKDAARKLDNDSTIVSRNNKFLLAINALDEEGQKKVLTPIGEKYAIAIRNEKPNPATEIREGLFQYSLTDDLIDYVKINSPSTELFEEKILELANQVGNSHASKQAFLNVLLDAGILNKDGDELSAHTKTELETVTEQENQTEELEYDEEAATDKADPTKDQKSAESMTRQETPSERGRQQVNRSVSYSVDIQLHVDPDHSKESVEKTIEAITTSLDDEETESQSEEKDSQKGLQDFS